MTWENRHSHAEPAEAWAADCPDHGRVGPLRMFQTDAEGDAIEHDYKWHTDKGDDAGE